MKRTGQKKVLSFVLVIVMLTSLCGFYVQAEGSVGDQSELTAEAEGQDTRQQGAAIEADDPEEQDPGDSEEQDLEDSEEQDLEDSEEQDLEDSEEQDLEDSEEQDLEDSQEQDLGDSEEQDLGDSEEQDLGDSEEQDLGDSEEQEPGDSEEQDLEDSQEQDLGDSEAPAALTDQAINCTASDGAVITISGCLPEGAYVTAVPVTVELEEGIVLAAYDITIHCADDSEFQPDEGNSVQVSISSPEIEQAVNEDPGDISVYHMEDENAEPEEIGGVIVESDAQADTPQVSFTAESFSVYVITIKEGTAVVVNGAGSVTPLSGKKDIDVKLTSGGTWSDAVSNEYFSVSTSGGKLIISGNNKVCDDISLYCRYKNSSGGWQTVTYSITIEQGTTVNVTVNNSGGTAVNGAAVYYIDANGDLLSASTNSSGVAQFATVPGAFSVSASKSSSYGSAKGTAVLDQTTDVSITLNAISGGTFNHIDIDYAASFSLIIDGTNQVVNIDQIDRSKVGISAKDSSGNAVTNFVITGNTENGGDSQSSQYRFSGTFPKGTSASPINYYITYPATFTVNGQPVTITFTVAINFFSAANSCPGSGSQKGIDVELGGTNSNLGMLMITKNIVNSSGTAEAVNEDTDFCFTVSGSSFSDTFDITVASGESSGYIIVGPLNIGAYTIAEVNVPDDYVCQNAGSDETATISSQNTAQVIFTNAKLPTTGTLTVTKTFSGNGGRLPVGFSITVTDSTGQTYPLTLADATGSAPYTWALTLPLGAFSVSESGTDITDYTLDTAKSTVSYSGTLKASGETASLTNAYNLKTITVSGTKDWKCVPKGMPLPQSITVELLKNGTSFDPARTVTVTAADNWKYTFNDAPEFDNGCKITYTVRETAIDGTEFKDGRFIVYGGATAANGDREVKCCWIPSYCGVNITNTYVPSFSVYLGTGSFSIQKYKAGTENEPLCGVTFTLTKSGMEWFSISQVTPADGRLTFSLLPIGTYTLTETQLSGYASAGPWEIVVTDTGKVLVDVIAPEHGNIFTNIWNWLVNITGNEGFSSGTLTVYNALVPTYSVTYNDNVEGAAITVPDGQTKIKDINLNLSSSTPTYGGHVFAGWNTSADGSGDPFSAGGIYTENKSITLYAQWKDLISFYININGDMLDNSTLVSGHSADLFSDAVYSDTAKYKGTADEDTDYVTGSSIDEANTNVKAAFGTDGKLLLTAGFPSDDAIFTKLKALYPSGSTSAKIPLKTFGKAAIVWANLDTTHYSIQWYVAKDQADAWHVDGVIVDKTVPVIVTHTVSYTWSGSYPSDAVLPSSADYKAGDPVKIASNPTTSISSWTFNGWTIGGVAAADFTMGDADVSIVGSWSNSSEPPSGNHTVSYTWSGSYPSDAVLPSSANYKAGDPVKIASNPTTSISNWTFNGWTIGGVAAADFTMGNADVSIVGSWSNSYVPPGPIPDNYYKITYSPGEHGTFVEQSYTRVYGALTPAFDGTPTGQSGWTFTGWSPAVDPTVAGSKTYTAQWQESVTPPTTIPESPPPLAPTPDPGTLTPVTPIPENPVPGAIAPVIAPTDTPQTGDDSNVLLLAILAVLSAAGLGTVGIITRKKKHNK